MKLALSSCCFFSYAKEGVSDYQILEAVKKSGFSLVDYNMTPENFANPVTAGQALRHAQEKLGVQAFMAHAPNFNPLSPENLGQWESMKKVLAFCKEAGIPAIVIHPGGAEEFNSREAFFEKNVAYYRSFIPMCEETGVRILIENIGNYADPYYLFNGHDLMEMLHAVDSPMFGICWDTGHANHFYPEDCDQYDSITAIGSAMEAIHFQDNAGYFSDSYRHHRIDMHMAPYMSQAGSVNYDAVIKGLVDIGYKGAFNMELTATNLRSYVEPFILNGKTYDRLRLLPLDLSIEVYRLIYEIGKFMLQAYDAFEE